MRFTFGFLFLIFNYSLAQNLVPNPDFEAYLNCPKGHNYYGMGLKIPHWYSPTRGTPDYFNECGTSESKARANWAGRCEEFNGQGYVGIITYMDRLKYREYLAVELTAPLDSGVAYSLQFSFRLSSYSGISSGNVGMVLMHEPLQTNQDEALVAKPNLVAMIDSAIVMETGGWQMAAGNYIARGGEKFLLLGNFSSENSIYRIKSGGNHQPMLRNASFYYFDDVVVQPQIQFDIDVPVVLQDNPFEYDSTIVLRNVQFAYNSDKLNSVSEGELNKLYQYLSQNTKAKIEIYGHTDDQGTADYNRELSLRRARSVAAFLINQGIDENRLKYFGFGMSQPLIHSADESARSINRRVEVKLVE